jgi:hypothetical protein
MTPAQHDGWKLLLDLGDESVSTWCLVGGQMVWLLAAEYRAPAPRATEDMDLVVDVRADPGGIRQLCAWLVSRGLELEGISSDGIGHRYSAPAVSGPGRIIFDVLAPDRIGQRADLTTSPPARTLSAPGARAALDQSAWVPVSLAGRVGSVCRPSLVAAILAKTAATTIAVRGNPERDWTDAAFLLSLIPDPMAAAAELSPRDRQRLRRLDPLRDEGHPPGAPSMAAARCQVSPRSSFSAADHPVLTWS